MGSLLVHRFVRQGVRAVVDLAWDVLERPLVERPQEFVDGDAALAKLRVVGVVLAADLLDDQFGSPRTWISS